MAGPKSASDLIGVTHTAFRVRVRPPHPWPRAPRGVSRYSDRAREAGPATRDQAISSTAETSFSMPDATGAMLGPSM